MAFRSSAITSSATGGTLTATPAGVQAHDYLGLFLVRDDTTAITIGYPTGFTEQVNADQVLPDKQTVRYADKPDASGADSFAVVTGAVNHCALTAAAWSGRDNSTPRSTAPVKTNNTTANASAISATITGITATANDDIAVWMFTDQTLQASRWTFSTITNYTERQDGVALDWVSGTALDTRDNVSGGATGNFSTTITDASASTAGYGGIVVAIKAAPASAATPAPTPRLIQTDRVLATGGGLPQAFAPRKVHVYPSPASFEFPVQNVPPLGQATPEVMRLKPFRAAPFLARVAAAEATTQTVTFDPALMAAMSWPWPTIVISQPQVVASGMTPPDNVPN